MKNKNNNNFGLYIFAGIPVRDSRSECLKDYPSCESSHRDADADIESERSVFAKRS